MRLEESRWTLLRGSQEDVRELAAVLGVSYDQLETGQFVHSNLVTVLDTRGEIIHQQAGTDDLREIVRVLRHTVDSSSG
jgi:protein SCO1/2